MAASDVAGTPAQLPSDPLPHEGGSSRSTGSSEVSRAGFQLSEVRPGDTTRSVAAMESASKLSKKLQKKAKALKKKLKQVAELQTKVDGGLAPSDEQKEKLGRGDALRAELAAAEERLSRLGI